MSGSDAGHTRRQFLGACAGAAVGSMLPCTCPAQSQGRERPPNFIIILADDQGYRDLGCFGAPAIRTLQIDAMAAAGMRFTDFYAAAPLCTPSRAALLTGCYPRRVGLEQWVLRPDSRRGLHPDEITLAELLRGQGYATGCIGKWHLGFLEPFRPTRQGFDYYYGLLHNLDKFEAKHFEDIGGVPILRDDEVVLRPARPEILTELYTTEAIEFIRRNKDRPFFLYLAHTMPHTPLGISDRFKGKSAAGLYGDVIECLDWSTGEILKTIEALGLAQRTMVVYTSDNGSPPSAKGSALPLRGYKNTTYEGGMRVPCVMWAPGRIPRERVCSELATMMDLYPTFAAMAGATVPGDRVIDGKDIRSLMSGAEGAKSPYEAFYYHDGQGHLAAVRAGRWKLHLAEEGELYNLEDDIGETDNVATANPDVVRRLRRLAQEFDADLTAHARPAGQL